MSRRTLQVGLAAASVAVPGGLWLGSVLLAHPPVFNDFHSFWLAARLLLEGRSPYDLEAMRALAHTLGLTFVVGTGYSYPLPFAFFMIPFAVLPFEAAVLLFSCLSIVGFGWLVSWWLLRHHPHAPVRRLVLAAIAAGAFPPIFGSISNGQANLLVVIPLGVGLAFVVDREAFGAPRRFAGVLGGALIGLAAIVKIVPGAVVVPMFLGGRRLAAVGLLAAALAMLALAAALAPPRALEAGWIVLLLEPDPYFTNQSINGFVSRLVLGSGRTAPLAAGLFDPSVVGPLATVVLAGVTVAVLVRWRRALAIPSGLALGLALALVASTIGGPKNSFWNITLALPSLGLLVWAATPELDLAVFNRAERRLLIVLWAGLFVQFITWLQPLPRDGPLAPITTLLGSSALYGLAALWLLIALRLRDQASSHPRTPIMPTPTALQAPAPAPRESSAVLRIPHGPLSYRRFRSTRPRRNAS